MRARLESRVVENPADATGWRLLGRWYLNQGLLVEAASALEASISLAPQNTAAHAALAQVRYQQQQFELAERHAQAVIELAPGSEYAAESRQLLARLDGREPAAFDGGVSQVDYEITRFDNSRLSPSPEEVLETQDPDPWRFRIESGIVYNSNVTLTPINRELFPGSRDSAQFFVAPELEFRAVNEDDWALGPTFLGHFTFNEEDFSNLNLQSIQPGVFLERVIASGANVHVGRFQYGYTRDAFDGTLLGNRHTVMASAATVWECQDLTFGYVSADHTDIRDDGAQPSVTGRDGWTYRLGGSHTFQLDRAFLKSIRIGIDGEYADLSGSDFRYGGVSIFTALQMPVTESLLFELEGGWGYRDYFDFDDSAVPSRNENIWRAGARLTKTLSQHWSVAGVFNFDQFDSKNQLFAADRFLSGVVAVFEY